jgi:hypothetical protein
MAAMNAGCDAEHETSRWEAVVQSPRETETVGKNRGSALAMRRDTHGHECWTGSAGARRGTNNRMTAPINETS